MWFRRTACDLDFINIYFLNDLRFIDCVPAHAPLDKNGKCLVITDPYAFIVLRWRFSARLRHKQRPHGLRLSNWFELLHCNWGTGFTTWSNDTKNLDDGIPGNDCKVENYCMTSYEVCIPKFSTSRTQKSFKYQGSKIWNLIPANIRNMTFNKFKAHFKDILIEKYSIN